MTPVVFADAPDHRRDHRSQYLLHIGGLVGHFESSERVTLDAQMFPICLLGGVATFPGGFFVTDDSPMDSPSTCRYVCEHCVALAVDTLRGTAGTAGVAAQSTAV